MAKTNSYEQGFRILKTLEFLRNLPEPKKGQKGTRVKTTELAEYLSTECEKTNYETAKQILLAICDSDTGYFLECDQSGGKMQFWYRRPFSLEQISLLSTIISSSMFLNEEQISTLLAQLRTLTSDENAAELSDASHFHRPRMINAEALNNLRIIHQAINEHKALRFYIGRIDTEMRIFYDKALDGDDMHLQRIILKENGETERTETVNRETPEEGMPVVCSPYELVWDNSRCYLICGMKKEDQIVLWNYRVDRMFELKQSPKSVYYLPPPPHDIEFQTEQYLRTIFKMFPSEKKPVYVTLRFQKRLTRVIAEKYGFDTRIYPEDGEYAHAEVMVRVSRQFYGWLAGFEPRDLRLIGPIEEVKAYSEHLRSILEQNDTVSDAT